MTSTHSSKAHKVSAEKNFSALADETRLRCLLLMAAKGELCVCELVYALRLSQPKISRHLKLLRDTGLVSDRRERNWVYYCIAPNLPDWMMTVIDSTLGSHADQPPFRTDAQRLSTMPNRPESLCSPPTESPT